MPTKPSFSSSSSSDRVGESSTAGPSREIADGSARPFEVGTASDVIREVPLHRRQVLVIDESRERGQSICRLLRLEGYPVSWTGSYERAFGDTADGPRRASGYGAVVVGLPAEGASVEGLLTTLATDHRFSRCGQVLVTAQESAALRQWISGRSRIALVLDDDLEQVLATTVDRVLRPPLQSSPKPSRLGQADPIRILFVDDSAAVRKSYEKSLGNAGYEVDTAKSCEEGFEKACRGSFDLAIVDYFMPDATGDVLCRKLAQDPRTDSIRTVVITAAYLDQVIHDSIAAGALDCVFKNEAKALFLTRIASVSRAVRAERAKRSRRRHLEAILESVGDGVYGVDCTGRITFINHLAKSLLGYGEDDSLVGGHPHSLFHYARDGGSEVPLEQSFLERVYLSGEGLRAWETTFWHRTGRPIPVECNVFPLTLDGCREGSVVAFRDISERRRLYERLWWLATHDPLTGLRNRRFFEEQLLREIQRVRQSGHGSALLLIDIDHFRYINETAGPAVGDLVLVEVARTLQGRIRQDHMLARLGGDEFATILQDVDLTAACRTAETLRQALRECTFDFDEDTHSVYASIGVEVIGPHTTSSGDVLANADIACNLAKKRGRNRIQAYDPQTENRRVVQSEFWWSSRLRSALQRGDFVLHFQPILKLDEIETVRLPKEPGRLWGEVAAEKAATEYYEVLVRLEEPSGGTILPNEFLGTAQRFNLMLEIDLWVISNALETLARVTAEDRNVVFFVNLAAQTLHAESLLPFITVKLRELGLDPGSVIFEVTETDAIQNLDHARALAEELRGVGCKLALDDFGSGFSSFQHLKHLPVDLLKIDGLFIRGMLKDSADLAMVASMAQIARSLGCQTVAEHVENADVIKLLEDCGIDFAQGNYLSPPLETVEPPGGRRPRG